MSKATATYGFGFRPDESPHHFALLIPRRASADVLIEERFVWGEAATPNEARVAATKAKLDLCRWTQLAERAETEFNRRLRAEGRRPSSWRSGETLLAPYFGKELTLLFWAIEEAELDIIPNMLGNWLGLAPEERWWLFTTINAAGGHPEHGKDRGWRKAIKIAFAENPLNTQPPATYLPTERSPLPPSQRPARPGRPPRKPAADSEQPPLPLLVEEPT